jgi:hypothetical protein
MSTGVRVCTLELGLFPRSQCPLGEDSKLQSGEVDGERRPASNPIMLRVASTDQTEPPAHPQPASIRTTSVAQLRGRVSGDYLDGVSVGISDPRCAQYAGEIVRGTQGRHSLRIHPPEGGVDVRHPQDDLPPRRPSAA